MEVDNRVQILADSYPLEDMLRQNDIEAYIVVKWLVDEGLVDLSDYFGFEDEEVDDESLD